ncbi:MAG: hypothetical protein MI922_19670, partial [Bacteroidales bacterium]|nr:hypothetical protein [Bacteroidales bacterium]
MKIRTNQWSTVLLALMLLFSIDMLKAQNWQPTNGPAGGDIPNMAMHPSDSSVMFAVGRIDGLFKTTDYGSSWNFIPFNIDLNDVVLQVLVNETNPDIIICASNVDIIKTTNGGTTWKTITTGMVANQAHFHNLVQDISDSETIYTGGGSHDPTEAPTIYMSEDFGENWTDIGASLSLPIGVFINTLSSAGTGKLYAGINDETYAGWGNGKVYYTSNSGTSWSEVNYGQSEPRFIWSIHTCAYDASKIWISEGPLYNTQLSEPFLYLSDNGGSSWSGKTYNKESFDASQ